MSYNRPDLVASLLALLKPFHKGTIYLACDGPKHQKDGDAELVTEVQRVMETFESQGDKRLLFQSDNLGARDGVWAAVDWFFQNETEGIVLEDDALPSISFFTLAEQVLDIHRTNQKVWGLGGFNPTGVPVGDSSYGFIRFAMMAGAWASWSNRWSSHDRFLIHYRNALREGLNLWPNRYLYHGLDWHLKRALREPPKFWDYQLSWSVASTESVWAISGANLVLNVGFRADATHAQHNPWPDARLENLSVVRHPQGEPVAVEAERLFLKRHLRVYWPLWLNHLRNVIRGVKRSGFARVFLAIR